MTLYDPQNYETIGYRIPQIGELILVYQSQGISNKWQKVVAKVDKEINRKCFVLKEKTEV